MCSIIVLNLSIIENCFNVFPVVFTSEKLIIFKLLNTISLSIFKLIFHTFLILLFHNLTNNKYILYEISYLSFYVRTIPLSIYKQKNYLTKNYRTEIINLSKIDSSAVLFLLMSSLLFRTM